MVKESLDYWQDIETYERYTFDSVEGKKRIEEMEKYFPEFKESLGKRIKTEVSMCEVMDVYQMKLND